MSACAKAGNPEPPGWTPPGTPVQEVFSPSTADLGQGSCVFLIDLRLSHYASEHVFVFVFDTGKTDLGGMHSIGAPIHVYPLYENAFRAHRQQSLRENNDESAALYAEFAQVAAQNGYSWNYGKPPASKEEIGSVSKRNRMICAPCKFLARSIHPDFFWAN